MISVAELDASDAPRRAAGGGGCARRRRNRRHAFGRARARARCRETDASTTSFTMSTTATSTRLSMPVTMQHRRRVELIRIDAGSRADAGATVQIANTPSPVCGAGRREDDVGAAPRTARRRVPSRAAHRLNALAARCTGVRRRARGMSGTRSNTPAAITRLELADQRTSSMPPTKPTIFVRVDAGAAIALTSKLPSCSRNRSAGEVRAAHW